MTLPAIDTVTHQQFAEFRSEMRAELASIRATVATQESRLQIAQEKQSGDIAAINAMMNREQLERKSEIDSLRKQFTSMSDQLQTVASGVSSLATSMAELSGMMRSWKDVLDNHRHAQDALKLEITETRHDVDLVMSAESANTQKLDNLSRALYGDPTKPDAPDSLYKLVGNLSAQVKAGADEHNKLILSLMTQGQGTIARLDTIESWQKAQAEKWTRRKQVAKDVLTKALTSKPIIAGIVVTLLALIAGLLPQAATTIDSLIAVFQKALGQ